MKNEKGKFLLVISGVLMLGMVFSASCNNDDDPDLPPIGGYNNSNEVAAANLVAQWTL
jgi:hypothetical protein